MKSWNFKYTLCAIFFVIGLAVSARAEDVAESSSTVVLDSVSATDRYAIELVTRLKQGKVTSVELYHAGEDNPDELQALTHWLTVSGIRVYYHGVKKAELDEVLEEQNQKLSSGYLNLMTEVEYAAGSPTHRSGFKLRQEILARIRHFFGVPKGISFLTYSQERPIKERLVEVGVAVTKTVVTSAVLIHSLAARKAMGEDVNMVLPVIVAAAFNLGFDYWQRGNSAFKGQGVDYDFMAGRPKMNRKFYLLTALVHSVFVREAIMASAHLTGAGFSMGWSDAWIALQTSLKGLLGKAPIEMLIEKGRRTHGPWWTIGWMTMWGSLYASLQILDMFQMGDVFRIALTVTGSAGLVYEIYKDRSAIYQGFTRLVNWIRGARARDCRSLLVPNPPEPDATIEKE